MVKSISEIIKKTSEISSKEEKVKWLQQNESPALRDVLHLTYDKQRAVFLIPQSPPPYNPSGAHDNHGALYREARKFKYLVAGTGFDNLNQMKRENIFIEILETVHKDDAEILLNMIQQKPFKGITSKIVNEAFPNLVSE
jgi:hypothetical protein